MLVNQVLNAGKNKLISMDQVRSIVNLRALILNGESCNMIYPSNYINSKIFSFFLPLFFTLLAFLFGLGRK